MDIYSNGCIWNILTFKADLSARRGEKEKNKMTTWLYNKNLTISEKQKLEQRAKLAIYLNSQIHIYIKMLRFQNEEISNAINRGQAETIWMINYEKGEIIKNTLELSTLLNILTESERKSIKRYIKKEALKYGINF